MAYPRNEDGSLTCEECGRKTWNGVVPKCGYCERIEHLESLLAKWVEYMDWLTIHCEDDDVRPEHLDDLEELTGKAIGKRPIG